MTSLTTNSTYQAPVFNVKSTFLMGLATSGVSVCVANTATNPIDVIKIRQQLTVASLKQGTSPGLVRTGIDLVRLEGPLSLASGLSASLSRAVIYGSLRLGLYGPIKSALGVESNKSSVVKKVTAGITSGTIATIASNPVDLIKTRMQAKGGGGKGAFTVLKETVKSDGITGLWKGTMPSFARAAVLTAAQCTTYDEVKLAIMKTMGWGNEARTHFVCSMITGLVSTTATAPIDMIKTQMFVNGSKYNGPLDCMKSIFEKEGIRGLFKGWTANYVRLGPQTVIVFLVMEKLRELVGMDGI